MPTTFGFSAFLKLINSNARPQRQQIRKRFQPSKGGYDYHKAMRGLARRYLVEGTPTEYILTAAAAIVRQPERQSAIAALNRLFLWRISNPGIVFDIPERTFQSPRDIFRVRFAADFGVELERERVAAHIWNTMKPPLERRMTRAGLSLLPSLYEDLNIADFAVLSLRDGQFIRLGDPSATVELADNLVEYLEELFIELRGEPDRPGEEDRPLPV